jgi:hypothetical protein
MMEHFGKHIEDETKKTGSVLISVVAEAKRGPLVNPHMMEQLGSIVSQFVQQAE